MGSYRIIEETLGGLRGDGRGWALLAITGGSFLTIGVQMIYPVLLPELRSAFGLDLATAGILLSVLWIVNAFGQLPGGMLADRIGEKSTLLVSSILTVATLGLLSLGTSVAALFVSTGLLGLGIGLFGVARYTAMLSLFPDRAGTSIGVVLAGADAGQALLPPIAGVLAVLVTWQIGFAFAIPMFLLLIILIWRWVPGKSSDTDRLGSTITLESFRMVVSSMRTKSLGLVTVGFFMYVALWITFTSFYPTYLIEIKELSPQLAGILFGLFFAIGIGMKPLAGAVYDWIGIRFTLFVVAGTSGVAWMVLPFIEGVLLLTVATVFMAPILGTGTITQTYLLDGLSEEVQGTGLGVVRTAAMTMGGILPSIVGTVADRGFFDEAFLGLAAVAGLLVLLAVVMPAE